jgi:hypothetical protein
MELNNPTPLTQDALVIELHKLGYDEASQRELASFRKDNLLPPFDQSGKGRGRGPGRGKSLWLNGQGVIAQASWIYRLFRLTDEYDDVYLALWILGYDIPLEDVWESLYWPLEAIDGAIEQELKRKKKHEVEANSLEEIIDDAVVDAAEHLKKELEENQVASWMFQVPQTSMAASLNILLNRVESKSVLAANRGYNLEDTEFREGKDAYIEWKRAAAQKCAELFGDDVAEKLSAENPNDTMLKLFNSPQFINKYLSLPRFLEVLGECTYEDLIAVRRDVQVGREAVIRLSRALPLIRPKRLDEFESESEPEDLLPVVFSVSRLLILADLSFRRAGCGELIDQGVLMLGELLKRFNEWMEGEGPEVCQQIAAVFDIVIERLLLLLTGEPSPRDQSVLTPEKT